MLTAKILEIFFAEELPASYITDVTEKKSVLMCKQLIVTLLTNVDIYFFKYLYKNLLDRESYECICGLCVSDLHKTGLKQC